MTVASDDDEAAVQREHGDQLPLQQRRDADVADVTDVANVTAHGDGVDVGVKEDRKADVFEPLSDDGAGDRKITFPLVQVERPRSKKKYRHAMRRMIPIRGKARPDECPFERAGLLSMLTYHWMQPLLWRVYRRGLREEDVWPIPEMDAAEHSAKRLSRLWDEAVSTQGEKASLWRTIWRLCRTSVLVSCLALCVHVVISFLGPAFVLRELLSGLENKSFTLWGGILLAMLLTASEISRTLSNAVFFTLNYQMGIRIHGAVTSLVYDKILRLRHLHRKTAGDFVNLFSSDASRLFWFMPNGLTLPGGPLITVLALVYLWYMLGPTVLIGFSLILLFYPLQILVSRLIDKYRRESVAITDKRVRLMNEVLTYVKLIKMYAWEASFSRAVRAIRVEERRALEKAQFLKSVLMTLVPPIPTVAAVLTLIAHTQLGYSLSIAQAFTLLAVFNCISPKLSTVPAAVLALAEAKVAADRFEQILRMEEVCEEVQRPEEVGVAVQFSEATLGWDVEEVTEEEERRRREGHRFRHMSSSAGGDDVPRAMTELGSSLIKSNANVHQSDCVLALKDISITIPKGCLVGVCGKYGSGKSSLLAAILGQMKLVSGSVRVGSDVAYVSQQAFILNTTVRENILFGARYDQIRYDAVLDMCQLSTDVTSFPSQDLTEIGERGINLSGGQKQRLSLARAVYADKEIYLLDDVLSAVDVSVGRQIFTDCIKSQLRRKTVILVTHQLQYLEHCDQVVYIDAGRVKGHGTHADLMENNDSYAQLVNNFIKEMKSQEKKDEKANDNDEERESSKKEAVSDSEAGVDCNELKPPESGLPFSSVTSVASQATLANGHASGKLIEPETRREGHVTWSVYRTYIQSAGGLAVTSLVLVVFMLNVSCMGVSNWWLSYWLAQGTGNGSLNVSSSEAVNSNPDLWFYNSVHAGLLATIVLTSFIRSLVVMKSTLHASSELHDGLYESVMSGDMAFFDTTPAGRILNRFARDLDDADTKLPVLLDSSLQNIFRTLMALVVISLVFPYFLVAVLPLILLFLLIQRVFRHSLRELKRLECLCRSPLLSHVMCTVQGLYTLQAYERQKFYGAEYRRLQDKTSMLMFLHNCAKRWLTIRLDLVATSVVMLTAVLAVVFRDALSPAYAGLALSYAIQMTGLLQYALRLVLETEAAFTAVERLDEYRQDIDPEGRDSKDKPLPSRGWPVAGEIRLEGVRMRYRPGLPSVLRDVSAVINAGEKVGIVGRTGSGKSSLCAVIFRLVELSAGRILIDGTNVADLDLHQLRSRLSVIPQDPVLFVGSVRYNVDPFMEHSDEDVWNALHQCHISPKIRSLPGKLEYVLVENGGNFSVGERQLVCLARALLRNSKILIMDEATASVDAVTDSLIQQTISSAFSSCTVLTIAHRLNTVQQCGRILVLKRGKLVEFDTAENLLANPKSAFYHMTKTMMADLTVGPVSVPQNKR